MNLENLKLISILRNANEFHFYRKDDFDYVSDEYSTKGDWNVTESILEREMKEGATSVSIEINLEKFKEM